MPTNMMVVKQSSSQSSNTRRERLAASRDKNRAMWRTACVLAVKNRLRDYHLFERTMVL